MFTVDMYFITILTRIFYCMAVNKSLFQIQNWISCYISDVQIIVVDTSDVQDVYLANKSVSNIPLELGVIITTNEPKCSASDRWRWRWICRFSDNACSWVSNTTSQLWWPWLNIEKITNYVGLMIFFSCKDIVKSGVDLIGFDGGQPPSWIYFQFIQKVPPVYLRVFPNISEICF